MHTFYIKESFHPIWEEFIKLVKIDSQFSNAKKNDSGSHGLISSAIMTLINNYVQDVNSSLSSQEDLNNVKDSDNKEKDETDKNND
jgi:hypothetical protein